MDPTCERVSAQVKNSNHHPMCVACELNSYPSRRPPSQSVSCQFVQEEAVEIQWYKGLTSPPCMETEGRRAVCVSLRGVGATTNKCSSVQVVYIPFLSSCCSYDHFWVTSEPQNFACTNTHRKLTLFMQISSFTNPNSEL